MGGSTDVEDPLTLESSFRCPRCIGRLEIGGVHLACTICGSEYPIVSQIPRFVPDIDNQVRQVQRVFDFEHRRHERSLLTQFGPHLVEQFLADCRMRPEFFEGKVALDAGCGSGRWSYALAELGAEVTAIDLTAGGIESTHAELGDRGNMRFAQADLFQLPFEPETFDFVMSWGVLHHTRDTHAAFSRLVPLVRPGGTLYVMVYERIPRSMWIGTEALRRVLRRLPEERRYGACRYLVIDSRAHPKLVSALGKFFMIASYDPLTATVDPETYQFGLFDAYSPKWNHVHTRDEVSTWFRESGFEHVTLVDSPHGAVKVRGVKSDRPARRSALRDTEPADVDATWIRRFTEERGRPPRVLHMGNIANNGYLNAKIQRREGIDADVVSFDYYHVMGCPEWEDADFEGDVDEFYPDWWSVDLRGWTRPEWFVQGPMAACITYLLARREGRTTDAARSWRRLERERWLICRRSALASVARAAALAVRAVRNPRRAAARLKRAVRTFARPTLLGRATSRLEWIVRLGAVKTVGMTAAIRSMLGGMPPRRALARYVFPTRLAAALTNEDLVALETAWAAREGEHVEPQFEQKTASFAEEDSVVARFRELFPDRADQLRVSDYLGWQQLGQMWAPLFEHYDVVQAYATYPLIPLLGGKHAFAAYEHGTLRDIPFDDSDVGRVTALGYREAPAVFVTNADDLRAAERLGIESSKVTSLPHAVDTKKLFEFGAANAHLLPAPESQPTFFAPARQDWVAGFQSQLKGNDRVVRAVRLLRDRGIHVNVVFVDWGRHVEDTRRLIAELECESAFTWVTRLRKEALWARYLGSHAVIDQFVMHAIGGVTFEAMALGRRVITALDSAVNEEFFGAAPPVLAASTPDEIANAMRHVAEDPLDSADVGTASELWIRRHHSSERIVALQVDAYKRMLEPAQMP